MPNLSASISGRLDVSALVMSFVGGLSEPDGPLSKLTGIELPATTDDLAEATGGTDSLDASAIGSAALGLASSIAPMLANLPGPAQAIAPLQQSLGLVHELAQGDLQERAKRFVQAIETELGSAQQGGLVAALVRIGALFQSSPDGARLGQALEQLLGLAGVDVPVEARSVPAVLPAISSGVQVIAGLMGMESALFEAERLSELMVHQLDGGVIRARMAAFTASLTDAEQRVASLAGASDDAALRADAEAGIRIVLDAAEGLRNAIASGMGFCEATLAYLDVGRLITEIDTASNLLRSADLPALEQSLAGAGRRVAPWIAAIDLSPVPQFSLESLLAELEGRIAAIATQIRALDVTELTAPLSDGLGQVTHALSEVSNAFTSVIEAVQSALESVRQAIQAIPFDQVIGAIHSFLTPVRQALEAITSVIAGVEDLLEDAAAAAQLGLDAVEGALTGFKTEIDGIFGKVQQAVGKLDVSAAVGEVASGVRTVADAIRSAELKPYFDTAAGAISTTADVIGAVPFDLLPDSMESDVEQALKPIRDVDVQAVKVQLEDVLQIRDGKFQLRDEVVDAVHTIQLQYEELITVLETHNPRKYLEQVDAALEDVKKAIEDVVPAVALEPVQEAIDNVKGLIAGFDLREVLKPVDDALEQVLTTVDGFSPNALLEEPERLLDEAREALLALVHFREWKPAIEGARAQGLALLDRVNPTVLAPQLEATLTEIRTLLDRLPDTNPLGAIGQVITAMLSGSGMRIEPLAFSRVVGWLGSEQGTPALEARARNFSQNLIAVRSTAQGIDLSAFLQTAQSGRSALAARIASLPAGDAQSALTAALGRLDIGVTLSPLLPNQARLTAALTSAEDAARPLAVRGFSEVNVTVVRLRAALEPFSAFKTFVATLARRLGLPGLEQGLVVALRGILDVLTPARITGLVVPLFEALKDRLVVLVDSILTPIIGVIDELTEIVDAFDLGPLRASLDAVYQAARAPIAAFKPSTLLSAELDAFDALKLELLDFDPLGELLDLLEVLQDGAARVIDLLKAERLLEVPLATYDQILAELSSLNVEDLATPLLDAMDAVAEQVHEGLGETVEAFERLQASLPGGGGSGGSASVSVSASIS